MASKKQRQSQRSLGDRAERPLSPSSPDLGGAAGESESLAPSPSANTRRWVSIVLALHCALLIQSLAANLAPSLIQGKIAAVVDPYLVTTGQAYGRLPLELSHSEPMDFPLAIEARRAGEAEWRAVELPGVSTSSAGESNERWSRWPNFARLTRFAAVGNPESEILSDIASRLVHVADGQRRAPVEAIRFVAPKVLSYDEDAIVVDGQGDMLADQLAPAIVYSAHVVRQAGRPPLLLPSLDTSRTARPAVAEGATP